MFRTWKHTNVRRRQVGPSPANRLEVYDRDDRLGRGRCMSLFIGPREIVRIDLFVPAHRHDNDGPRVFYPADLPFERHVELALVDLARDRRISPAILAWARAELLR